MFCNKFHAVTKRSQMHPNTTKHTETLLSGPMGWIECVHCEKSCWDFVAQTFALIAPVHHVLHQVSSSYEMIPNAPKYYETHQNMSLGSNGVDQVCSLRKLQCDFTAQTCALIASVQPIFIEFHVAMKDCQMHPNTMKHTKTGV